MAYVLPQQKQQAIIHLLVEGNSIRSIERLTGVHRDTIMRLAVKVGGKCQKFLNAWMRNLKLRHIQADEIWTFVGCKEHNLKRALVITEGMGDQYLYVAFDQDTKLIATYAIGRRSKEITQAFMYDLADRIVTDHPQLSTDGFNAYPNAVKNAFGDEIAYGQIIKEFAEPVQPGRYGPPVMVASERRQITGLTEIELKSICTSHVERNNLTILCERTTCVATQDSLFFSVFPGILSQSNWRFRGEKRGFDGTVDPVVAGSSPVALACKSRTCVNFTSPAHRPPPGPVAHPPPASLPGFVPVAKLLFHLLVQLLRSAAGDGQRRPFVFRPVSRQLDDLAAMVCLMRERPDERIQGRHLFAANCDCARQVRIHQFRQRGEQDSPARFPARHQARPIRDVIDKFRIPIPVRLLAVTGQKIAETRNEISARVLHDDGQTICVFIQRQMKLGIRDLSDGPLHEALVALESPRNGIDH
jgi:transposase-like protein